MLEKLIGAVATTTLELAVEIPIFTVKAAANFGNLAVDVAVNGAIQTADIALDTTADLTSAVMNTVGNTINIFVGDAAANVDDSHRNKPRIVGEAALLAYDELSIETIKRAKRLFKGTGAEIRLHQIGTDSRTKVGDMAYLNRAAIATAAWEIGADYVPTGPLTKIVTYHRELQQAFGAFRESIALVLYDTHRYGSNPHDARALYRNIMRKRRDIPTLKHVSAGDLKEGALVVNPLLDKDVNMPRGVSFIVEPGFTEVYPLKPSLDELSRLSFKPAPKNMAGEEILSCESQEQRYFNNNVLHLRRSGLYALAISPDGNLVPTPFLDKATPDQVSLYRRNKT